MFFTLKKIVAKLLVIYAAFAALVLVFSFMNSAIAVEIEESVRTVPLNDAGDQVTLTIEELSRGQQKFNSNCAQCHIDGGTKPNPDVDLSTQTLAKATPSRNSVASILDYLENPTTYDGLRSLANFIHLQPILIFFLECRIYRQKI